MRQQPRLPGAVGDSPRRWRGEGQPLWRIARGANHGRCQWPLTLLSLFALEIALKGYQILDCGRHTHDHDLRRLFDSLSSETKTRLKELGPEVPETIEKHHNGFVSLRYQFEEVGDSKRVAIPRAVDPLHGAARTMVEALAQEPSVREVAVHASSRAQLPPWRYSQ